LKKISKKLSKRWGIGPVVIPEPIEMDELMGKVPGGKLFTINDIRAALVKNHKATIRCPITAGIFTWIASHAAEKQGQCGARNITPYWRTLKTGEV